MELKSKLIFLYYLPVQFLIGYGGSLIVDFIVPTLALEPQTFCVCSLPYPWLLAAH